jgi:hypothetical protein
LNYFRTFHPRNSKLIRLQPFFRNRFVTLLTEDSEHALQATDGDVQVEHIGYGAKSSVARTLKNHAIRREILAGLIWIHVHIDDVPLALTMAPAELQLAAALELDFATLQAAASWPAVAARRVLARKVPGTTPKKRKSEDVAQSGQIQNLSPLARVGADNIDSGCSRSKKMPKAAPCPAAPRRPFNYHRTALLAHRLWIRTSSMARATKTISSRSAKDPSRNSTKLCRPNLIQARASPGLFNCPAGALDGPGGSRRQRPKTVLGACDRCRGSAAPPIQPLATSPLRRVPMDSDPAAACTECPCRSASGPPAPLMGPGEAVGDDRQLSWKPATAVAATPPSSSQLTAPCATGLGTPPPPILRAPAAPRRDRWRPRWAKPLAAADECLGSLRPPSRL